MKKFYLLLIALSLFALGTLQAQEVILKTPDMQVDPAASIHLDLLVGDFEMITGIQFSLNWDPDVLEFVGVDNFGLPGMTTEGNFGILETPDGKLRFSWYQQEVTGVTLADMSPIFSVWFKVVGQPATATQVKISNEPIIVEVISADGIVPFTIQNGTVTVQGANATTETVTVDFVLYQNSPNPFTDITYVRFDLNKATEAHLSIYDQSGKAVFSKSGQYTAGSHAVTLERSLFQSAGTYLFTLKTANGMAARQLVLQ